MRTIKAKATAVLFLAFSDDGSAMGTVSFIDSFHPSRWSWGVGRDKPFFFLPVGIGNLRFPNIPGYSGSFFTHPFIMRVTFKKGHRMTGKPSTPRWDAQEFRRVSRFQSHAWHVTDMPTGYRSKAAASMDFGKSPEVRSSYTKAQCT